MNRRVLFIIGSGAVGGRELQLVELARGLRAKGWEPGVVFLDRGGPVAEMLGDAGIPIWLPPTWTYRRIGGLRLIGRSLISASLALPRSVRAHQPDVVHAMLFTSVWLGLPLSRRLQPSSKRVAGVYGFTELKPTIFRRLYGRALRKADFIVANAPHLLAENQAEFGLQGTGVGVIANGVCTPSQTSDPAVDPPVAVTVANFHTYKGHSDLLHAIAMLHESVRFNVRLCGVGTERDRMAELVDRLGIASKVTFVPPPANIADELLQAQFAIHPSHTEGLSNAILEELASGLPVVAYDVGGNGHLIEHGVNGFLHPVGDVSSLAASIEQLARDPELRRRMGAAARRGASRFGWDRCIAEHIALYESLQVAERTSERSS